MHITPVMHRAGPIGRLTALVVDESERGRGIGKALVIATVQAVKVLGIHCAAKHIESQAALQWLTAIGCDFAQGSILSRPQLMDSLLTRAPAPG